VVELTGVKHPFLLRCRMTLESIISIVSGIFGIISGIVGFCVFVRKYILSLPQFVLSRSPSSGAMVGSSARSGLGGGDVATPAVTRTPNVGTGDSWKVRRDALGDLAPPFFALLGFTVSLLIPIVSKIATGELNTWYGGSTIVDVIVETLALTAFSYFVGCLFACIILGLTPLFVRYGLFGGSVVAVGGTLIGWLAVNLKGAIWGALAGMVVGLCPVAAFGACRFFARWVAWFEVAKYIDRPERYYSIHPCGGRTRARRVCTYGRRLPLRCGQITP